MLIWSSFPLMSGDAKLISTIKWRSKADLLSWICSIIRMTADDETLDKKWIQSTRPYPINLDLRKIKNILCEDTELDHESFNMAIWMVARNQEMRLKKQKYHFMDLKFAEITQFGQDPRCCDVINSAYHDKLKKVLECWPNMQYKIQDCSSILLPYYQNGLYILFIMDMQNKTVHIMDPLQDHTCLKGYQQEMTYIPTFHNIARMFHLAMGLSDSKWRDNIYS